MVVLVEPIVQVEQGGGSRQLCRSGEGVAAFCSLYERLSEEGARMYNCSLALGVRITLGLRSRLGLVIVSDSGGLQGRSRVQISGMRLVQHRLGTALDLTPQGWA